MFISKLKVLWRHGRQSIPDLTKVQLPAPFRGRPLLSSVGLSSGALKSVVAICPSGALTEQPFTLDMGRCLFCGQCERMLPSNIRFTQNWRLASLTREGLVVDVKQVDKEREAGDLKLFRRSIKLRQVCAGGDGSCEMELGSAGNVNFDMRRHGIEFTASPRHADGVVFTGPITKAMSDPLEATFAAVPRPRVLIAVGVDAISGGMFENSPAVDRSFLDRHIPDLYVPGNPPHPLTFIDGIAMLRAATTQMDAEEVQRAEV